MTDHCGRPETGTTHTRAGVVYAVLAAASAALLLFLPVLLLGITMSVVAAVLRGDVVGWQSSGMTYTFVGIPALLSLFLLVIPSSLFQAAGRRLGARRAIRWVGDLLVAGNAGVALIWARQAMSGSTPAIERPEVWYAVAFGVAAVVILIATVAADKRAVGAAVALFGVLGVALVGLVAGLVAVWGSPPRIPANAQVVHVVVTASAVRLDPATVHAGDVYFVVDEAATGHAGFGFVSRGYGAQCCEDGATVGDPLPMSDEDVARLTQGDYQGTGIEAGWGKYAKFTLLEGNYAFLIGGDQPGVPPPSIAVLEVLP